MSCLGKIGIPHFMQVAKQLCQMWLNTKNTWSVLRCLGMANPNPWPASPRAGPSRRYGFAGTWEGAARPRFWAGPGSFFGGP